MVEDKIVPFQRSNDATRLSTAEARQLGDSCRKLTLTHLKELLQKMFDTADDTLFKLAETSGNDSDQGLYFDSMRIIRFKRDVIEEALYNQISDAFRDFWINTPHEESGEFKFTDELSLVEEQDLEEELAIKNLIRKIRANFQQDISAIEKRLSEIVSNKTIDAHNNPTGPETICKAFQSAALELNADIKIKLILFKLFDFHVSAQIGTLYQKLNEIFIEAGVLPQLKLTINKKSSPATTAMPATSGEAVQPQSIGAGTGIPGTMTLADFQQLLHQPAQTFGPAAPATNSPLAAYRNATAQSSVLTSDALVSNLTPLQNWVQTEVANYSVDAVSQQIRQSIIAQHPAHQINPIDNDIIDLVSMLFEFALDDQHIPVAARNAIARLQIPVIKAAILDKEFFNINGHPARKLLNSLAHAGLDLPADIENASHPVLDAIQQAVDRILHEFNHDLEVFTTVLEEFEATLESNRDENKSRTDIALQPFYQKEQQILADQWVTETIHEQIENKDLPEPFISLLLGAWKSVMLDTYLDEGPDGSRWKNQKRFIDILCWSIEPKFVKQDRKKLGNILRFLIETLNDGLVQINTPQESIEKITQALEPYHYASLHGKSIEEDDDEYVDGVFQTDHLHEDSLTASIEQLQSAIDELPDIDVFEIMGDGADKELMENIVLESFEPDASDADFPADEYLELARHLEAGKWVEFTNDKQQKTRARLAWKSDLLGEFTFLNWKFDVIADKKLFELASDFRHGKAKVIDDLPLIDRAFSAIMNTLQGKAANG